MPIIHRLLGVAALVVVTSAQGCADSAQAPSAEAPSTEIAAAPSTDAAHSDAPVAAVAAIPTDGPAPTPGKYGCTASRYSGGAIEYEMKGSFVLAADGDYEYHGFETPSAGRYRVEPGTGKLLFEGGYFDAGEATPVEDRPNKYFVVFPTIPDNRWSCGLATGE